MRSSLFLFGATRSLCALWAGTDPAICATGTKSRRRARKTAALQDRTAVRPGTCMIIWAFSISNLVHLPYASWCSPTVAVGVIVRRYYILLYLVHPLQFLSIWTKTNSELGDTVDINSTVYVLGIVLIGAFLGIFTWLVAHGPFVDRPPSSRSNDPLGSIHSVFCRSSARRLTNKRP